MKNLNKRNKIVLAIAGTLLVVAIAMVVFFQAGGEDLFGSTVIRVSPENPTVPVYQAIDMSVNSMFDCTWSSNNHNVAMISGGCGFANGGYGCSEAFGLKTKKVLVVANWPGQAVIKADCTVGNRYSTVTVGQAVPLAISPAGPTIAVGGSVKLSTTDASCIWTTTSSGISLSGGNVDNNVTVKGVAAGMSNVTATCHGGVATATVNVQ